MKNLIIYVVILCVGMAIAYLYLQSTDNNEQNAPVPSTASQLDDTVGNCSKHGISEERCPWCNPGLIEEMGECKGHGVPEALCSLCNEELIAGFKAENDWCGGHNVPESQCDICLAAGGACEEDT